MMPSIHARYVKAGLKKILSEPALDIVRIAAIRSDDLCNHGLLGQHCDTLPNAARFIKQCKAIIIDEFVSIAKDKNASTEAQKCKNDVISKILYFWGRMCHAIQDPYAHSNYPWLSDPSKRKLLDLNLLDNPKGLKTYKYNPISEVIDFFRRKINPGRFRKPEFIERFILPDPPDNPMLHSYASLDHSKSPANIASGGKSFREASRLAIRHTRQLWNEIEADLRKQIGDQGTDELKKILKAWDDKNNSIKKSMKAGYQHFEAKMSEFRKQ